MRMFEEDRWGLLGLFAALLVALVALAFTLTSHRDAGTGMRPVRLGPPRAAERLLSPLGLAWRLQRGAFLGWLLGMAALSAVFGALGNEVGDMLGNSEQLQEAFGSVGDGDLVDAYMSVMMGLLGTLAAGFAIQALLRMRTEEAGGALEPVLASAVSRLRWMASHGVCAAVGTLAILLVSGLAAGLSYGVAAGEVADGTGRVLGASMVQAPAAFVVVGFVVAAFAFVPRLAVGLAWSSLVVCLVMGQLGSLLDLPQAALNVSPYTHVPAVPAADVTATPLVALTVTAVALAAAGFARFRQRDLAL